MSEAAMPLAGARRFSPSRVLDLSDGYLARVPQVVVVAGALAIGFVVSFARNPSVLAGPALWAEDGTVWFANAYNRGWWSPLLKAHTGYLQTFPRVIADFGLLVSLRFLPLLFALVALFVQALPAALICSSRMADLLPSRTVRVVLAACYLALPNAAEVNANLTNSQWHLGLSALLIVLALPGGIAWSIADCVVLLFSGLTGPFCLALLPVAALIAYRRRHPWSLTLAGLVGLCAVVQAIELATSARGKFGPLGMNVVRFVEIVGGQIVAGTLFGSRVLSHWQNGPDFLVTSAIAFGIGVVLVGGAMIRGPVELRLINLFVGLVLGGSLLTPVATGKNAQWFVLAHDPAMRYWFLPAFALVVDVVWLACCADFWQLRVLGLLALASTVVLALPADFSIRPLVQLNWSGQVTRFLASARHTRFSFAIDPRRWHMVLVRH